MLSSSFNNNLKLVWVIAGFVVVLILLVAYLVWVNSKAVPSTPAQQSNQATNSTSLGNKEASFSGQVLAGNSSPLLDFNQADYEKTLSSNKLIVLYFYANWCPICREEVPKLYAAFNELTSDRVIGFRVNYNDSDTDSDEKNLAREFGIAYQHSKVFLRNSQRILKSPESWDKDRYTREINSALAK